MSDEQRDVATRILNVFGAHPWLWYALLAFVGYELVGSCVLAVMQLKWGDRKRHPEYGFALLFVWEWLAKTTFDVIGLARNLVRWFLPTPVLRMLEGIGLLPADVHVPARAPEEPGA